MTQTKTKEQKTEEEFNLSEKIVENEDGTPDFLTTIRTEDVKEFIRRLKEEIENSKYKRIQRDEDNNEWEEVPAGDIFEKINKLAGEKLKC